MATPTADDIAAAAAQTAADGVLSAASDGQTATALDPLKQLEFADKLQSRELLAGARSAWGAAVRPARVILPGAT